MFMDVVNYMYILFQYLIANITTEYLCSLNIMKYSMLDENNVMKTAKNNRFKYVSYYNSEYIFFRCTVRLELNAILIYQN